ncbi:phage tail protein X family protein [Campylobacter pinnipediorum subsp. pinnipediorum]|uniref:tail protein X n=1 Tax=Campylobacter pinnipediorum TaxID=1965231 RepID=UPI00099583DD|nr:tail protein X [Campylobacter pinnipediorum]AQW81296.1 phage tail protein X family protein [Campylobacter pinnipediorum subsp. pinnipediorum]
MKYLAKDGDTLDMLCYKQYKTLDTDVYSEFLRENEHLLNKNTLQSGDIVFFPDIEVKKVKKVVYLWD